MPAPTLVFAWGNPSRGDDALGPLFAEAVEALRLPGVEVLTDFQLQVEHALDLLGRERVLFVDASVQPCLEDAHPFQLSLLVPQHLPSHTTHALRPEAVLQVFADVQRQPPPPAWLLSIPGEAWGLGEPVSHAARQRLDAALRWASHWLAGSTRAAQDVTQEAACRP
jgi:hydrogenase maturation protease